MSKPILFAVPADIELAPAPIRPNWIIEGNPEARSRLLAESADRTSSVMAWSCTAGCFRWCYSVDETVHIISGEVFVTDGSGATRRLGPGDMAFFPAGSRSTWTIPNEVRKLAVCRHSMPRPFGYLLRAWNKAVDVITGFSAGEPQAGKRPAAQTGARIASA
jgi:uncharacterized cupin superfamily protein